MESRPAMSRYAPGVMPIIRGAEARRPEAPGTVFRGPPAAVWMRARQFTPHEASKAFLKSTLPAKSPDAGMLWSASMSLTCSPMSCGS